MRLTIATTTKKTKNKTKNLMMKIQSFNKDFEM